MMGMSGACMRAWPQHLVPAGKMPLHRRGTLAGQYAVRRCMFVYSHTHATPK